MKMYRAWITFTSISVVFFMVCLATVIFRNRPVFQNYWQEALLTVSILNLRLAYLWYRRNRDEFAAGRRKE